ncbi:MAG: Rpp14/Pop5 family protein [Candidatus Nitrosocosmicus sp.]|nr:Rpp14/Pop5 family protein [Candidatus Nitrosocosmicus sp.]MDN5866647.1 Rpp14/Pop5 family protein [Candidatus Nitrosocosmicus sp.]
MTLSKKKYRYVGIYLSDRLSSNRSAILEELSERYLGLFGSIDYSKANIRIIKINNVPNTIVILKCRLESLTNTLISLGLIELELMVVSISGTLKQLKKKIFDFLKYVSENQKGLKFNLKDS